MNRALSKYYAKYFDELFRIIRTPEFNEQMRFWVTINRYGKLEKKLTPGEAQNIAAFLGNYMSIYQDADDYARTVLSAINKDTYERACEFALQKIGVQRGINFNLTNRELIDDLNNRAMTFPRSSKAVFTNAMNTIERRYIEQGTAPYDQSFVRQLQRDLGYQYEYEAVRFARSETGHIQSAGQYEVYQRNGVEGKEWITATFGVRPTHQELNHERKRMNEDFLVGGNPASYPMDSRLPPEEFCNCRCDIIPYYFEDYGLPQEIWAGQ
jgi:hypothetical protein